MQAFGEADIQAAAGEMGPALFFVTMDQYVGAWAVHAMYVLIVTSVYASQLAFHNAINRYVFDGGERHAAEGVRPHQPRRQPGVRGRRAEPARPGRRARLRRTGPSTRSKTC